LSKLEFKEINIDLSDNLRDYLSYNKSDLSDYTVGFIMMWKDPINLSYAVLDDVLIVKGKFFSGRERFYMPSGKGNLKNAILSIKEYCDENNIPMEFNSISPLYFDALKEIIDFEYVESRDYSDYVYAASDLSELSGRKYHQKRNHISKFKKKYDYDFKIITADNIKKVQAFYDDFKKIVNAESISEKIERNAAQIALDNIQKIGLIGAFIEVDEKVVAFTVGEIKADCLYVHVEKANREYEGSYATINNEFVKYCAQKYGVKWVNREDDSGDEGLRKAKLSYNPHHLALKGKAVSVKLKV